MVRISREDLLGYTLIIPASTLSLLLFVFPAVYNFFLSLTNKHLLGRDFQLVWLTNYFRLFNEKEFWVSLTNGLIYGFVTTIGTVTLGTVAALLLHQATRGKSLIAGFIIFPYLLPTVVSALVWKWMLNDLFGILPYNLKQLGLIEGALSLLGTPSTAMLTVIAVSIWRFFPFASLFIVARLQIISTDWYDSAKVDGASLWQRFLHITLPQLREALFLIFLLRFIWIFNMFDVIWLLTQGGPVIATQHLPIYVYLTTFKGYDAGLGSTISMLMFGILLLIVFLYFKLYKIEV